MNNLPPLSALRAFEAVSRLGSVTAAAQELHVTHSAISHQLKLLETYLNISLIDRSGRRVGLTPDGRVYAYQVRLALQQVAGATRRISMRGKAEHLSIALLPSFGMHWLVPRLPDFYAKHPNWQIELVASLEITDFETSTVDCAIRFGSIERQNNHSAWLMGEWQLLVASSKDVRFNPNQTPLEALQAGPIIATHESWSSWFLAAGVDVAQPSSALSMNDSNLTMEAARSGLGAVLTRLSIADLGLKRGELQCVTGVLADYPSAYYMVWPHRSHQSEKLLVFMDWLKTQCREFEQSVRQPALTKALPFGFLHADKLDLSRQS